MMGKKNVLVRFRSAMGGFHKGDVTKYVVKLHEEYKAALAELEEKCAALTRENETLRQAVELERLTELENQNRELIRKLEALEAKAEELSVSGNPELREKELEAYRRAEAMERRASQRYQQVKGQVEQISDAMVHDLSGTVDSAKNALEAIGSQLQLLQNATEQLQATMDTGVEKLETMASEAMDH